jgi:hypothetical protein
MSDWYHIPNFSLEYNMAQAANADRWVPACGGHEQPCLVNGHRYLYCYNPRQRKHAYLDMESDRILEPDELPPALMAR